MKKTSFILNIVFLLTTVFFVVFAQLKSMEAEKQARENEMLAKEAASLMEDALKEAANAREAETVSYQYMKALEECKKQNN